MNLRKLLKKKINQNEEYKSTEKIKGKYEE